MAWRDCAISRLTATGPNEAGTSAGGDATGSDDLAAFLRRRRLGLAADGVASAVVVWARGLVATEAAIASGGESAGGSACFGFRRHHRKSRGSLCST